MSLKTDYLKPRVCKTDVFLALINTWLNCITPASPVKNVTIKFVVNIRAVNISPHRNLEPSFPTMIF